MSWLSALFAATMALAPEAPARRERVALTVFDPALEQRLVAELAYLGFEPVIVPPHAHIEHAVVAISETREGNRLEILLLEPAQTSTPIEVPSEGRNARDLAIRTAELVRVSLEQARSTYDEPSTARVDATPPAPKPAQFAVSLGPAIGISPGGLGASYHLRASIRYAPHPTYGVVLAGTAPLRPELVTGQEGTADLWFGWMTLGVRFAFRPSDAIVRPELGIGAGIFVLTATGRPTAAYAAKDASLVTGIAELSGGVEFTATPHIRFRTIAALATCFPRPEVRFAGNVRAHTCLPMGLGEFGVTIAW